MSSKKSKIARHLGTESDPKAVAQLLKSVLPEIESYSSTSVAAKLFSLCGGLKKVGIELETEYKAELDMLQTHFTGICRDSAVDPTLRLKTMEIIELRTLGWETNEQLERFYSKKLSHYEELKRYEKQEQEAKNKSIAEAFASKPQKSTRKTDTGDDKQRFKTSVHELFPNLRERECLIVDVNGEKVKLFLSSTNVKVLKEARVCLAQHFASKSSGCVSYSKEDLVTLATTPPAKLKPLNIPQGVVKKS